MHLVNRSWSFYLSPCSRISVLSLSLPINYKFSNYYFYYCMSTSNCSFCIVISLFSFWTSMAASCYSRLRICVSFSWSMAENRYLISRDLTNFNSRASISSLRDDNWFSITMFCLRLFFFISYILSKALSKRGTICYKIGRSFFMSLIYWSLLHSTFFIDSRTNYSYSFRSWIVVFDYSSS